MIGLRAWPPSSRGGVRSPRWVLTASGEVVLAVGAATAVVALMQSAAPAAGLGAVYLLAVLEVAVRRGERAAVASAALGFLALNFFFVAPRYQLAVAHAQDVVDLVVFLVAALVVGRLATRERARAAEADERAAAAAAREQEAKLLAAASSAVLSGHDLAAQTASVESLIAAATGASRARLTDVAPPTSGDEIAVALTAGELTWLVLSGDVGWPVEQLDRLAEPLGRLLDVARARRRAAEHTAEMEAARRAEIARTAVLRAISHDLRTPLTAITTAAAALRTGEVTGAEHADLVDVIDDEGRRLAKLVDDLLDLSMIEAGAVRPRADWCDLNDVLAAAAARFDGAHAIELALPGDLPLVYADAAQLERVFSNLLQNAVRFSPPAAPVRVSGGVAGQRVTVRVTDQGAGIPLGQRPRVFEPFFRGRSGTGSGLGLAICRGFVEANGGHIVLQADSGQGTSFAVSFDGARQPDAPAPARR